MLKGTLMSGVLKANALAGVRIDDEDFANMMSALQADCGESHPARGTGEVKRVEDTLGVLPWMRSIDGATWHGDAMPSGRLEFYVSARMQLDIDGFPRVKGVSK